MTCDDLITRLEKMRADPEEEIRFTVEGDATTEQEIASLTRVVDDGRPFIEVHIRNT